MLQITTIENVLIMLTGIFFLLYLFTALLQSYPEYFFSKTILQCRKMQKQYNKLISSRRDMIHHYYWADSNKQSSKVQNMIKNIRKIDQDIHQMYENYQLTKSGIPTPLKLIL